MSKEKRIKYFSYYGCADPRFGRSNSPAADSKIDYIIDALNRCGYGVDLISHAPSSSTHYVPGSVTAKGINTVRYFASYGGKWIVTRKLNSLILRLRFFLWCLCHLKKGEQVLVYHSLGYDAAFVKLARWRQIRIVGEIEEIYQDVHAQRKAYAVGEYKFFGACSKYLFPTSLLNDKLNASGKPSVVVHGVYATEPIVEEKYDDGRVHVVYGGTLDPNKGGAAAAAAAAYLPKHFHVHICGFGDPTQIKAAIAEVSARAEATVTFEGELKGDDYKHFIQKCHIGLSTQNPDAAFNATSFPSKILVYLSNGLKVVTIDIPAIRKSGVADSVFFYHEQTPKMIAAAIEDAAKKEGLGSDVLKNLDRAFVNNLKTLLEG